MAQTRRAQILMEPAEYRLLEEVARRQGTSVAELFRSAVRRVYLATPSERMTVVKRFSEMSISLPDWEVLEAELEEAHDGVFVQRIDPLNTEAVEALSSE